MRSLGSSVTIYSFTTLALSVSVYFSHPLPARKYMHVHPPPHRPPLPVGGRVTQRGRSGGGLGTRAPLGPLISISRSFRGNGQNNRIGGSPLWGWHPPMKLLDPPILCLCMTTGVLKRRLVSGNWLKTTLETDIACSIFFTVVKFEVFGVYFLGGILALTTLFRQGVSQSRSFYCYGAFRCAVNVSVKYPQSTKVRT